MGLTRTFVKGSAVLSVLLALLVAAVLRSGPATPLACALTGRRLPQLCPVSNIYGGALDPKFKPLEEAFRQNFLEDRELGAQMAAYVGGKRVIDMWGTNDLSDGPYTNTTLHRVFSSTKVLEALVVAVAADKGYLAFDEPIAKHWPGFAKNGKEKITVSDLMRHSAGLHVFHSPMPQSVLVDYMAGKYDPMAKFIEDSPPQFHGGHKQGYHAITRGFVLAELLRRVDPQGRPIQTLINEWILGPLDLLEDYQLPIKDKDAHARVIPMQQFSTLYMMVHILAPYLLRSRGLQVDFLPPLDSELETMLQLFLGDPSHPLLTSSAAVAFDGADGTVAPFNKAHTREWVFTSASGLATGHALARVAHMMANGGQHNGKRIMSEAGYAAATVCDKLDSFDYVLNGYFPHSPAGFGCGLHKDKFPGGVVGWGGWGGSLCMWNREKKFAIGYAMNMMGMHLMGDPRLVRFINAAANSLN